MSTIGFRKFLNTVALSALVSISSAYLKAEQAPVDPEKQPAVAAYTAQNTNKPVNFRAPSADLNAGDSIVQPIENRKTGASLDELVERRDTLESDIRYGKTKVETNRKRAEVYRALGKNEEADRLQTESKDYEARVRNSREQLEQIEDELGRGQPTTRDIPEARTPNATEAILPGNNLEIFVNEDTSFNGRYQVRRGGYIIMPQVGRVQVAGKTITQAEASVQKALQATQLRHATVMIERFEGVSDEAGALIYLSGEFRHPRPYRIPQGTSPTLVSVILSAGGWTDRADLSHVKVMRVAGNRSIVEVVDLKKILNGEIASGLGSDLTLTEGDVVVIPSGATNLVYVTGRVKKSGSYRIGDGEKLTVYGAILQSGGLDNFANEAGVHVLRSMPDGTKAKLPTSIKDIKKGRRPDVILQPNDIIVVPEKWFAW